MSSGREKTWRPEKTVNRAKSRKARIIGVSALLVAMLAVLVRLLWPGEAVSIHFVTFSSSDPMSAASILPPVSMDLSYRSNQSRFDRLFDAFHAASPGRVQAPIKCRRIQDLDLPVRSPRDQVLAYVSVKARAHSIGESTELEFADEVSGKTEWRSAKAFFQDFAATPNAKRPETLTLILLEMENQSPSITGSSLGPDCHLLLQQLIEELGREDLVVVTACAAGERSWELVSQSNTSTASGTSEGAAAPSPEPSLSIRYSGTVFGEVACQLFAEMDSPPLPDFLSELKSRVKETARKMHGVDQTVTVLTAGPAPDTRLLDRVSRPDWPQKTDQPAPEEEKAVAVEDSGKAEKPPGENASEPQPPERIAILWKKIGSLRNSGQSSASRTALKRLRCEALVFLAEQLLFHQQETDCKKAIDQAESLVRSLEEDPSALQSTILGESGDSLRQFLRVGAAKETLTPEIRKQCADFLKAQSPATEKPTEKPVGLDPPEMLTTYVLQQLRDLQPENRADFFLRVRGALLGTQTLPLPLATINAVLANQQWADDAEGLPTLLELLSLRDEILAVTVGLLPETASKLLSRSTWDRTVAGKEQQAVIDTLFIELAAAESWLVLGEGQWKNAKPIVAKVREDWNRLRARVSQFQSDNDSQLAQQQELPYLIQYFALAQERSFKLDELRGLERDKNVTTPDELQSALFELTSKDYPTQAVASRSFKVLQEQLQEGDGTRDRWSTRQQQLIPSSLAGEKRLTPIENVSAISTSELPVSGNGLWTGYWAARYLEQQLSLASTAGSPVVERIWQNWNRLKQIAIEEASEATASQLRARTELAEALDAGWKALQEFQDAATPESDLITTQDAISLLNRFFAQRETFKWEVASRPKMDGLQRSLVLPVNLNKDQLYLSEEGRGTIGVSVDQQLGKPRIELLAPAESELEIIEAGNPEDSSVTLIRRHTDPLLTAVDAQLLFINPNNIVLARQSVKVMPNPVSDWKLEVRKAGQEILIASGDQWELPLPPSLGKEPPTDFSVHLIRTKGAASKVLVQLKRITDDGQLQSVWPSAVPFDVPADGKIQIPLTAPPAAGAPAPAEATEPKGVDFSHGWVMSVKTPESPGDAGRQDEKTITVLPRCSSAESFLEIPQTTYNSTERKLSLQFRRQSRLPAISPRLMPVQVHFSPQLLANMSSPLTEDQRQDVQNSDSPMEFEFLQPLQGEATFFVSACGDPFVWGWKLTPNGNCKPLWEDDVPVIVAELSDLGVPAKKTLPGLTIFDSQANGKSLRPRVHVLGRSVNQNALIDFFVQQQSPASNSQTRLGASRTIRRFKEHSILVTAGEEGRWNITTSTEPWNATESLALKPGRIRMTAELKHLAKSASDSIELAVDTTEPEIGEIRISSGVTSGNAALSTVPPDMPLSGEITGLRDSDSGIALIEVGCKLDDLKPLKGFTARAPSDRTASEKFTIPPEAFVPPEGPGPAKQELIVRVTNNAGMSRRMNAAFLVKSTTPTAMEKKEPAPFYVTFILGSSVVGEFKATVNRETKTARAGEVLQFGPLSAGNHDVKWEDKGTTSGSERIRLDDKGMIEDKPKVYQLP